VTAAVPREPQRIEHDGSPLPEGAVYVGPDSRWASPVTFSDVGAQYPSLDDGQVAVLVMRTFEPLARNGRLHFPNWRHLGGRRGSVTWTYPSVDEIRTELAGRDLACWCPPDLACHADVLLKLANEVSS